MPLVKVQSRGTENVGAGNRNIVINGAMQVAQRATQVTGITASGYQTVDRFALQIAGRDQAVFTLDQASDAPSGFTKSLKITTTTAESAIDADDLFWVEQRFEGQDVISLKNGLSDAEKVTLSFYVKSSITGTFGLNLYKPENTARIINSTYTISSADTWEFKTVTFDGDTSGGGTNNDNSEGFRVGFMLASGSTYDSTNSTSWANYSTGNWAGGHAQDGVVTTTNATWQLTGVQLEIGSQATPFEHRSFGEELALCQRYLEKLPSDGKVRFGINSNSSFSAYSNANIIFKVEKRANPTVTATSNGNSGNAINSFSIVDISTWGCIGIGNAQATDAFFINAFTADSEL
tara:strand:+ start:988 stop:2031 length:1044 start_codon:yes stop_codon:yes gene_type:complete